MSAASQSLGLSPGVQARRADAGDSKQLLDQENQRYSPNDFCRPEMHCSKELQQFIESMQQQKKKIKLKSKLILGETRISNVDIEDCGIILRHAALLGRIDIILELLNHGQTKLFIDSKDSEKGYTALMLAAAKGHKDCVILLLDVSASPHEHSANGKDAAHLATLQKHPEIAKILQEREKLGKEFSELIDAILQAKMNYETDPADPFTGEQLELISNLQKFLTNLEDVEYPLFIYHKKVINNPGQGPKFEAITRDPIMALILEICLASLNLYILVHDKKREQYRIEALKVLLPFYQKKGLINLTSDIGGCTPLQFATHSGHQQIVDLLIQHGANPAEENPKFIKPFSFEEQRLNWIYSIDQRDLASAGLTISVSQDVREREKRKKFAEINIKYNAKTFELIESFSRINQELNTHACNGVFQGFSFTNNPLLIELIRTVADYVFTPYLPSYAALISSDKLTSAARAAPTSALGAPGDDDDGNDPSTKPAVSW